MATVALDRLGKRYAGGGTPAVQDVTFEIVNVMELIGQSMGITADDIYKRLKKMSEVDAMMDDCADMIEKHGLDPNEARDVLLADQLAARPLQGRIVEK